MQRAARAFAMARFVSWIQAVQLRASFLLVRRVEDCDDAKINLSKMLAQLIALIDARLAGQAHRPRGVRNPLRCPLQGH